VEPAAGSPSGAQANRSHRHQPNGRAELPGTSCAYISQLVAHRASSDSASSYEPAQGSIVFVSQLPFFLLRGSHQQSPDSIKPAVLSHITLARYSSHSSHSLTTPTTTSIQMTMRQQVLKSQEGDTVLGLGPSIGVVSDAEGRVSPESTGSVSSFVLSNGDPLFVV
jgi:hypothetical protein